MVFTREKYKYKMSVSKSLINNETTIELFYDKHVLSGKKKRNQIIYVY